MIDRAIKALKAGGVIAFPTETVYGLGALLSRPKAIARIYKIKKRPRSKPLQVLVSSLRQAKELGIFNAQALRLAKKGWPGPLTLVVPGRKGKTIGLRVPAHRTVLNLIRKVGPIAATSANISGQKPFHRGAEVAAGLKGLDLVLYGRVRLNRASRIIDLTAGMTVLRP
ncbi:MAG: L-threonylcarbamoyladenylate synthase [Candidatus Margulisbacteria bacterium]|jgi:L-threonylcarbamoyladenylate synthase|nr:L-threonylcarbamoyladenylate synthase [Candidatus Margulisiibacteriota bacterium]